MNNTPATPALETIPSTQLDAITGGGIGSQIGGMFGAEGSKWGGIADNIMGQIGGGIGGQAGSILGQLAGGGGGGQ